MAESQFVFPTTTMANYSNRSTANTTHPVIYNKVSSIPIFLTFYAIILAFAIMGNVLVCWIVAVNKTMHEVTNYLLVNLAVSDLLQAVSTIFQVTDFVVKDLNLGDIGCKFQINMLNIPYGSSSLTLVAIAIERYFAVCKPMSFPDLKRRIKWLIPSIWFLSFCVYFPTIYYCGARPDKESNQLSCDCTYRWPSLSAKNIHGILIVVVFYFLPLVIVCYFYSNVIRRLQATPPGAGAGQVSREMHKSRQRVVKMLLVTIAIFFVLWTPYNILYLLKRLEVDYRRVYSYVWYPSLLLAFLSCGYNPIVYCLMGKKFRDGFKSALCCCNCQCHVPEVVRGRSSSKPTSYTIEHIDLD